MKGKWAALEVRLGGHGRARARPRGRRGTLLGRREKAGRTEGGPGRNQLHNPSPRGVAAKVAGHQVFPGPKGFLGDSLLV